MILSDGYISDNISSLVRNHDFLEEGQIQPASLDIRLGNEYLTIKDTPKGYISMDGEFTYNKIHAECYILQPGQFVLASTMEYFTLPSDISAFVEGRSSLGRMGLFVQNAGWVDPGFEGTITLELYNANRCAIELTSGRRVGQMVFARLDYPSRVPYNGKYQGQDRTMGSRIWLDEEGDYTGVS